MQEREGLSGRVAGRMGPCATETHAHLRLVLVVDTMGAGHRGQELDDLLGVLGFAGTRLAPAVCRMQNAKCKMQNANTGHGVSVVQTQPQGQCRDSHRGSAETATGVARRQPQGSRRQPQGQSSAETAIGIAQRQPKGQRCPSLFRDAWVPTTHGFPRRMGFHERHGFPRDAWVPVTHGFPRRMGFHERHGVPREAWVPATLGFPGGHGDRT